MAALRFLLQKTIQNRGKLLDLRQRASRRRLRYKTFPLPTWRQTFPALDWPQTSDFRPQQDIAADISKLVVLVDFKAIYPGVPPGIFASFPGVVHFLSLNKFANTPG